MSNEDQCYILGDIHAHFDDLNKFLDSLSECSTLFLCGDFGYYPNIPQVQPISILRTKNHKIYFCPGNHEDWNSLDKITTFPVITEIENNIFYCPFGSVLSIGKNNILFCGGAESPDWKVRTPGYDWFSQEGISYRDKMNLPCPEEVDINIIISHTCPKLCFPALNLVLYSDLQSSSQCLDEVYQMYKPKKWYFGHFHKYVVFDFEYTQFYGLNKLPEYGSILKMEIL